MDSCGHRLNGPRALAAMAAAFLELQTTAAAADLTREDWLVLLLDRESTARDNKRLSRRLVHARLRQNAVECREARFSAVNTGRYRRSGALADRPLSRNRIETAIARA